MLSAAFYLAPLGLLRVAQELQNECDTEQSLVSLYADVTIHKALCLGEALQQRCEVRREEMLGTLASEMSTAGAQRG